MLAQQQDQKLGQQQRDHLAAACGRVRARYGRELAGNIQYRAEELLPLGHQLHQQPALSRGERKRALPEAVHRRAQALERHDQYVRTFSGRGPDAVKLVRLVKDDLALAQAHHALSRADLRLAPVDVHHLPEVVLFARKQIPGRKLEIMKAV